MRISQSVNSLTLLQSTGTIQQREANWVHNNKNSKKANSRDSKCLTLTLDTAHQSANERLYVSS